LTGTLCGPEFINAGAADAIAPAHLRSL
jgi:hypothetical protein